MVNVSFIFQGIVKMNPKTRELIQKGFAKIKVGKLPNKEEAQAIKSDDAMVQLAYLWNRVYELDQENTHTDYPSYLADQQNKKVLEKAQQIAKKGK
jgi:hypothetical protein